MMSQEMRSVVEAALAAKPVAEFNNGDRSGDDYWFCTWCDAKSHRSANAITHRSKCAGMALQRSLSSDVGDKPEEFLVRISWAGPPNYLLRQGEVSADVGISMPNPPLTTDEMLYVAMAAKREVLRVLRARKSPK